MKLEIGDQIELDSAMYFDDFILAEVISFNKKKKMYKIRYIGGDMDGVIRSFIPDIDKFTLSETSKRYKNLRGLYDR